MYMPRLQNAKALSGSGRDPSMLRHAVQDGCWGRGTRSAQSGTVQEGILEDQVTVEPAVEDPEDLDVKQKEGNLNGDGKLST